MDQAAVPTPATPQAAASGPAAQPAVKNDALKAPQFSPMGLRSAQQPRIQPKRWDKIYLRLRMVLRAMSYVGLGADRQMFIQGTATMLSAGLPVVEALEAYATETRRKTVRNVAESLVRNVRKGSPLWRAMQATDFFSHYEIALVHIGEESGNLPQNMQYLAQQMEEDRRLRHKIQMAMIYPAIVLTLMFLMIFGLGIFVLPNLVQVLRSFGGELPLSTRILMMFVNFMRNHGFTLMTGTLLSAVALCFAYQARSVRKRVQWVLLHLPGVSRLLREATIARFGVILGTMLRAGVPLVQSLVALADITTMEQYRTFYIRMLNRVRTGDSFRKIFSTMPESRTLLPASVQQLVVTGERAGTLSEILLTIAQIYSRKAEETAQKLPIVLEPIILIFIGAVVGSIALAIITPIYAIVGSIS